MNRLVSQKMRLIPSLRAAGARIRPQVHLPKDAFLNLVLGAKDRSPRGREPSPRTTLDTNSIVRHTQGEGRPAQAWSLPLPYPSDTGRLCEKGDGGLPRSQKAYGNVPDSAGDWRRNAVRREHKHRDEEVPGG